MQPTDKGKALKKYNAPLSVSFVIVFFLVLLLVMFTWMYVIVPILSKALSPLENSSPLIYTFLQILIRFMLLGVIVVYSFVVVYFYQRHHDRKKARTQTPAASKQDPS